MTDETETRPAGIANAEPANPNAAVKDCSFVELGLELLRRAETRRTAVNPGGTARELSLCITALEDAIIRHNRAVYRSYGRFKVSDAEQ